MRTLEDRVNHLQQQQQWHQQSLGNTPNPSGLRFLTAWRRDTRFRDMVTRRLARALGEAMHVPLRSRLRSIATASWNTPFAVALTSLRVSVQWHGHVPTTKRFGGGAQLLVTSVAGRWRVTTLASGCLDMLLRACVPGKPLVGAARTFCRRQQTYASVSPCH